MTTKLIDRRPCQHNQQNADIIGNCYACGASAEQVIKDLHARVTDLTRRNEELRLELAAERLGSDL
jgi:hypothetical protein